MWTDVSTGEEPPADRVRVAFASDEYFALLDQYPEINRYLSAGTRLLINLAGTWIEITDE